VFGSGRFKRDSIILSSTKLFSSRLDPAALYDIDQEKRMVAVAHHIDHSGLIGGLDPSVSRHLKPDPDKPERIATKAPGHKEKMVIPI